MASLHDVNTCRGCGSSDVIGPFEMDGYADGEYQAAGLFWIVCRGCGRTTRVEQTASERIRAARKAAV